MTPPADETLALAEDYLAAALEAFRSRKVRLLPAPAEFAEAATQAPLPSCRLRFREAEIHEFGRLRFTGIEGRGTTIFSLMIFPHDPASSPVFASEFVRFGKFLRAAVVDWQPLVAGAQFAAADQYAPAELRATEELPAWCRAHFTPHAVFRLGAPAEQLPALNRAFVQALRLYVRASTRVRTARPKEEPSELAAYKEHHVEHTPGRPYLARMFGEAWTERFLAEAMYAPQAECRRLAVFA